MADFTVKKPTEAVCKNKEIGSWLNKNNGSEGDIKNGNACPNV